MKRCYATAKQQLMSFNFLFKATVVEQLFCALGDTHELRPVDDPEPLTTIDDDDDVMSLPICGSNRNVFQGIMADGSACASSGLTMMTPVLAAARAIKKIRTVHVEDNPFVRVIENVTSYQILVWLKPCFLFLLLALLLRRSGRFIKIRSGFF
jgi:hypothetical protein